MMQYKNISPKRILKVFVSAGIAKPLNGALPHSKNSHFLRLYPVTYNYSNGKQEKTATAQTYHIKGLRGALRHAVMQVCHEAGLEVCHTTDKEATQDGRSLLPPGFHLLGACSQNGGSCIVHDLFGGMNQEGQIAIYADPIANISHKTSQITGVQNVHIATEHRIVLTYDRKSVQDFGERYFSGQFVFEITVTDCSSEQLGLLVQAIMALDRLGAGYNAEYGHLKVTQFQLLERRVNRTPEWDTHETFQIKEEIDEKSLKDEVLKGLKAWDDYVAAHS